MLKLQRRNVWGMVLLYGKGIPKEVVEGALCSLLTSAVYYIRSVCKADAER